MFKRSDEIGGEFGNQALEIKLLIANMRYEDQSFDVIALVVGWIETKASPDWRSGMMSGQQELEGSECIVEGTTARIGTSGWQRV